jgi:uncharacterized protein YjbI with pentapeptide repeats
MTKRDLIQQTANDLSSLSSISMDIQDIVNQYTSGIRDFSAINLCEANLIGINLSGANLSEALLSVANLSNANLSGANLSHAKLNVARLSDANLTKAKLYRAVLNVANLIRANLEDAELREALLIRAEMIRANLNNANLKDANLNGSDLREATLKQANLKRTNLSDANLRGAVLTSANLEKSMLNGANLSRTDLRGVNLQDAELRQANLGRADLSWADLRGANLRWSDLSGANLSHADLRDAKLSGANLIGADLSNANLRNVSLVHADLTQARFIQADWVGADLTGANLTGAKLYGVSRFGLKTESLICEWIDLSQEGDRSKVHYFTPEQAKNFFNETLPTVQISIDAPLGLNANLLLASIYQRIMQFYTEIKRPPNIDVGHRRTVLTFKLTSNEQLFITALLGIFPFADNGATQDSLIGIMEMLKASKQEDLTLADRKKITQLTTTLSQVRSKLNSIQKINLESLPSQTSQFFRAPTQTILTNSSDQKLDIYRHPDFGKTTANKPKNSEVNESELSDSSSKMALPPIKTLVQFINSGEII